MHLWIWIYGYGCEISYPRQPWYIHIGLFSLTPQNALRFLLNFDAIKKHLLSHLLTYLARSLHFYRATLCVSADFAVGWCPSVRLSRSCIISRRLKISSNFFLVLVAPSSFFLTQNTDIQFQRRTSSAGAQNTRGGKILRFSTAITVYLGNTVRDGP